MRYGTFCNTTQTRTDGVGSSHTARRMLVCARSHAMSGMLKGHFLTDSTSAVRKPCIPLHARYWLIHSPRSWNAIPCIDLVASMLILGVFKMQDWGARLNAGVDSVSEFIFSA